MNKYEPSPIEKELYTCDPHDCIDTGLMWDCEICAPQFFERFEALYPKLKIALHDLNVELKETKVTLENMKTNNTALNAAFKEYKEKYPEVNEYWVNDVRYTDSPPKIGT